MFLVRGGRYDQPQERFTGKTITQAATTLIRDADGPLSVNEMYAQMCAGGMKFKGHNPYISIFVSLARNSRFCKVGPSSFDLTIRSPHQF